VNDDCTTVNNMELSVATAVSQMTVGPILSS